MKNILRVCHKYLKDNDGYDLGIQDLTLTTASFLPPLSQALMEVLEI